MINSWLWRTTVLIFNKKNQILGSKMKVKNTISNYFFDKHIFPGLFSYPEYDIYKIVLFHSNYLYLYFKHEEKSRFFYFKIHQKFINVALAYIWFKKCWKNAQEFFHYLSGENFRPDHINFREFSVFIWMISFLNISCMI